MVKKVKFYHYWDWKTIKISGIIIIGLNVLFWAAIFKEEIIRTYRISQLDQETTGKIIRIEEQTSMSQSRYGNIEIVDHFTVWYTYPVNGLVYTQKNWIDGNKKYARWLRKCKDDPAKTIKIKYDSQRPKKSLIILE